MASGVPGLQKFTYAVVFPVGMVYSVIAGGELFTGNAMFMTVSYLRREIRLQDLARNWLLVWIGNFLGGIAVAYLLGV